MKSTVFGHFLCSRKYCSPATKRGRLRTGADQVERKVERPVSPKPDEIQKNNLQIRDLLKIPDKIQVFFFTKMKWSILLLLWDLIMHLDYADNVYLLGETRKDVRRLCGELLVIHQQVE